MWTDPVSQDIEALRRLSDYHRVPILAVHAPCLLITQRVWSRTRGPSSSAPGRPRRSSARPPSSSTRRSAGSAQYAREFVAGSGGWRTRPTCGSRSRTCTLALPRPRDARPTPRTGTSPSDDYRHFTIDLSHTATARTDAMAMVDRMGDRLGPRPPRRRQRAPARTSTWCRAAAPSPAPSCSERLARTRLRRPYRRRGQHPPRHVGGRTRGGPGRGAGLHPSPSLRQGAPPMTDRLAPAAARRRGGRPPRDPATPAPLHLSPSGV